MPRRKTVSKVFSLVLMVIFLMQAFGAFGVFAESVVMKEGAELFSDPSFESNKGYIFSGEGGFTGCNNVFQAAPEAHSGEKAYLIDKSAGFIRVWVRNQAAGGSGQELVSNFTVGKSYLVSFWAKTANADTESFSIMATLSGNPYATSFTESFTGNLSTTWTKYSKVLKVKPDAASDGRNYFMMEFTGAATNDIYLDDLSIKEVETVEVGITKNLFVDPSFESNKGYIFSGEGNYSPCNGVMINAPEAHSGTKAYTVDKAAGFVRVWIRNAAAGGLSPELTSTFTAGKKYLLSFWAKTANADAESFSVKCTLNYGVYGNSFTESFTGNLSTTWTNYSKVLTVNPEAVSDGRSALMMEFSGASNNDVYLDDLDIIELCDMDICAASIENGATIAPADSTITIVTSLPADASTLSTITMNGKSIPAAIGTDEHCIDLTLSGLAAETDYSIDLSGVKDIYGQAMKTQSFTFSTESLIVVSPVKYDSVSGSVSATVTVTNNDSASKKIALITATYSSASESLVDLDVDAKEIAVGASADFSTSVTSDGSGKVISYVWDWESLSPYADETPFNAQ